MNLTEFLLARIAEDDAVARAAAIRPVVASESGAIPARPQQIDAIRVVWYRHDDGWHPSASGEFEEGQALFERFDPARVLAECEAKRRIVEHCRAGIAEADEYGEAIQRTDATCTLRLLALPYADHPDYDPSWRP